MTAAISKHFNEQIRTSIDYLRGIIEIRQGIDHAEQFDNEVDAIKRTKRLAHCGKQP